MILEIYLEVYPKEAQSRVGGPPVALTHHIPTLYGQRLRPGSGVAVYSWVVI